LDGVEGLTMPFRDHSQDRVSSHHLAVVVLPEGTDRDSVRAALDEQRIQTSVHYPPIHSFTHYRSLGQRRALPQTDALATRILTLPLYGGLSDEQVEAVIDALLGAVQTL
jgi:dTDP-4-amino-4,6-dideoxygalactose transaminase